MFRPIGPNPKLSSKSLQLNSDLLSFLHQNVVSPEPPSTAMISLPASEVENLLQVPPLAALKPADDRDWAFIRNLGGYTDLGTWEANNRVGAVVTKLLNNLERLPAPDCEGAREGLEEILSKLALVQSERSAFNGAEARLESVHASLQDAAEGYQQLPDHGLATLDGELADLERQKEEIERRIREVKAEREERVAAQETARQNQLLTLKRLQDDLHEAKSAADDSWLVYTKRAAEIGALGLKVYSYRTGPKQA